MAQPPPAKNPGSDELRLDGWGFQGRAFPAPERMLAWLRRRLDPEAPFPRFQPDTWRAPVAPALPDLGAPTSQDGLDRWRHARGQALADTLRARSATVRHLPAAVARPRSDDEVARLLEVAGREGLKVVPWGGGSSVTGGVNLDPSVGPAISADLGGLAGLQDFDAASGLATFGAGTFGPALEAALAERGTTLGHFPQSFEHSTLGGWLAAQSSGQESLGYGRIADLVKGLRVVAPSGRVDLPDLPPSASGPDLRRLYVGSEGRFGVITRATVRVRPLPAEHRVEAVLLPSWPAGLEAARILRQARLPLVMMRVSDGNETEVALSIGLARRRFERLSRAFLRWRGIADGAALMLLGAAGERNAVDRVFEEARILLRPCGAVHLGEGPGKHWRADRFRHPYLRDSLLDHGIAIDTLETAAPWSRLPALYRAVGDALREGAGSGERELPVLCHLSHAYEEGASLYFSFFFRCPPDGDAAIARWADLKRRASEAIAVAVGAASHHHGIGSWHSPWLGREIGDGGVGLLGALARQADPQGILNPQVLLDPRDRLEV